MDQVILKLNDKAHGGFFIMDGEEQVGEMEISISGPNLTVYHTEVSEKAEGKGFAKKMLNAMTDYARKNKLKVIPLCPFVHAKLKRHAKEYEDVWGRQG
jgi:uncharacterized protein